MVTTCCRASEDQLEAYQSVIFFFLDDFTTVLIQVTTDVKSALYLRDEKLRIVALFSDDFDNLVVRANWSWTSVAEKTVHFSSNLIGKLEMVNATNKGSG